MEKDLRARLLADAAIAAVIGTRADWGLRPAKSRLPALTLTRVSTLPDRHYGGRSGLEQTRVQIDVWGEIYGQVAELAALLPAAIEPAAVVGETRFSASFETTHLDAGPEEAAGGVVIFRRIIEFIVWHRPAT